jgi:hypothetical protein
MGKINLRRVNMICKRVAEELIIDLVILFISRMTFRSVVCGCTMDPEKAPVPMQPTIKSLRDLTAKELSGAIGRDMLVPGWEVKGGWKNWFQSIVKTVLRLIVGWFGGSQALFPDDGQNFEDRLIVYFLQQDYEPLVARQMAKDIANSL